LFPIAGQTLLLSDAWTQYRNATQRRSPVIPGESLLLVGD